MSAGRTESLDPRVGRAIAELQALITQRYPEATFRVTRSPEDPRSIHLVATVACRTRTR